MRYHNGLDNLEINNLKFESDEENVLKLKHAGLQWQRHTAIFMYTGTLQLTRMYYVLMYAIEDMYLMYDYSKI